MRAPFINEPELLTPFGNWLADRFPHIDYGPITVGKQRIGYMTRIYGFMHESRGPLFGYYRFGGEVSIMLFGRIVAN